MSHHSNEEKDVMLTRRNRHGLSDPEALVAYLLGILVPRDSSTNWKLVYAAQHNIIKIA